MIRAATQTEINEAFAAQRKSLGRVMTHEEIRALDAILARPIERGSTPRFDDAFVAAYAHEHHLVIRDLALDLQDARAEAARLNALINTPHTIDFLESVRLEAAHQRERWQASYDEGKTDADWYWLLAHLAGKAISKPEKLLHHIVTAAAALLNWHMARTVGNEMRPGISAKESA